MILRRRIMVLGGGDSGGYVDLGLPSGTLWAVGNLVKDSQGNYSIGAETDWGTYVSWGNIDGHNEGEGYNFDQTTYDSTSGKSVAADIPSNDSAHDICLARLGAPWHLPTRENFQELYDNTDSEWVADYNGTGVAGCKFMKKSDHSVYVFFPASGYYNSKSLNYHGTNGYYWHSSFYNSTSAYYLTFLNSSVYPSRTIYRRSGLTVRPVCKPMFSITITIEGENVEGITVTVTDSDGVAHSGTTDSNGVVQLTGVVGGNAKVSASGYQLTNSIITVNASSRSFTCGLAPLGVWAYYANGTIKSYDDADSNAIGVALVTENVSILIDKQESTALAFGGMNKDLTGAATFTSSPFTDFNGENNTTGIIAACAGYTASGITGAPAAEYCRTRLNGKGYLPSKGEMHEIGSNVTAVRNMMTKIGGGQYPNENRFYWTSTLGGNVSTQAWRHSGYSYLAVDYTMDRTKTYYARAICKINA